MLTVALAWIGGLALMCWLGYKHQASKTPEEQHLDFLIDTDDPYAAEYAAKIDRIPPPPGKNRRYSFCPDLTFWTRESRMTPWFPFFAPMKSFQGAPTSTSK